jgi:hypothetical protein
VDGGGGDHLAAFAPHVDAVADLARLLVADRVGGVPGEEEVPAAGARDGFDGGGQRAVGVFELGEGGGALLAVGDVDVEHPHAGGFAL